MIRILQVVNDMHRAGLETMLMNYYRNIDRSKYQFDFLTHRPYKSDYDDEILALGGKIYRAPRLYPQNYYSYFKYMRHFFEEHKEYKIMHSHIDAMSYLPLLAGKRSDVPVRIAHSHSTSIDIDWKYPLKQFFRKKIKSVATSYCACGRAAGEFLFPGQEFTLIPNAVDVEKFFFDPDIRRKKRQELGLENRFTVGHVGRFCYAKNHERMVRIFQTLLKKDENAMLLLVGEGEKEEKIRKLVKQIGIEKNVCFLGKRTDTNELYQAMDLFFMPSVYEGIPVVGVEAQCAGLKCLFSDNVPKEVELTGNCEFFSLDEPDEVWADRIMQMRGQDADRRKFESTLSDSRFNIKKATVLLLDYYENALMQQEEIK